MKGFSSKLDQLESRLKSLIEGNLSGLLLEREKWETLIHRIVTAMKTVTQVQADGSVVAPDVFVLLVNPEFHKEMEIYQGLQVKIAEVIRKAGESAGMEFTHSPIVTISPNSDVEGNSIEVIARNSQDLLVKTVETEVDINGKIGNLPPNTFLIVNGNRIFPLNKTLVNIGRRSTNDLVIEDQRVSRDHAQMRAIRGKYVLFDLNSIGGTYVNGQRISQRTLTPRDVISLAGIPLVYGQETKESCEIGQTQEMDLPFSDDDTGKVDSE